MIREVYPPFFLKGETMFGQHIRSSFRRIIAIIPEAIPSTTAGVVDTIASTDGYGENFDITLHCSTGDVYINATTVATSANGFKLNEDQSVDIKIKTQLSIVGGSTSAAYQALIWG